MHPVIFELILLAQQGRYVRGRSMFQWGVTGVGVAILIAAAAVILSKPKDPAKEISPTLKVTAAIVFAALGCGIIGYAWLAY